MKPKRFYCEFEECHQKGKYVSTDDQLKAIGLMRKHYEKYHAVEEVFEEVEKDE